MIKNNFFVLIFVMFFGFFVGSVQAQPQECIDFKHMATTDGCIIRAKQVYKDWGFVRVKVRGLNSTEPSLDSLLHIVGPYNPPILQSNSSDTVFAKLDLLQKKHGFTIVYYEFSEINEYSLQDKAFSLIAAIQKLDQMRGYTRPSIMMGLSLGGVVARYALTTLERDDYQHGVTHYVSFDSPHQGAHVPLALQEMFRFFPKALAAAEKDNSDWVGDTLDLLSKIVNKGVFERYTDGMRDLNNAQVAAAEAYSLLVKQADSPAARELLIHNVFANTPNQRAQEGIYLQNRLADLGMPNGGILPTNNIGVARGSISGQKFSPLYRYYFDWTSATIDKNSFVLKAAVMGSVVTKVDTFTANQDQSEYFRTEIFTGIFEYADASSLNGKDYYNYYKFYRHDTDESLYPYDLMACSVVELPTLIVKLVQDRFTGAAEELFETFDASQPTNCFIPSVSALAIPSISPQTDRTDLVSLSPFKEVFGQSQNSSHDVLNFDDCSLRKNGSPDGFCFWDAFKGYAEQSYSNVFWAYDNVNNKEIAVNTERLIPIFYLLM